MPTRRQAIFGLVAATFGGGMLSAGAFSTSTTADADFRVIVFSKLTLTPERKNEEYVTVDGEGEVTELAIGDVNKTAVSSFENLVRITNNGDTTVDEIDFEFEVTDTDTGNRLSSVEESLGIIYNGTTIHDNGGVATILDGADEELSPGDHEVFGVEVDLSEIGTLPEGNIDIQLVLTAKWGDST